MNLKAYFAQIPKVKRQKALKELARLHGKSPSTVYKWIHGDKHPVKSNCMSVTERWSNHKILRSDERPDVFEPNAMIESLRHLGYRIE